MKTDDDGPLPHQTNNPRATYSLRRVLGKIAADEPLDGVEAETHAELMRRNPDLVRNGGVLIPLDVRARVPRGREARDLNTVTGQGALATNRVLPLIDALRARQVVTRLGGTMIDLPRGSGAIPRKTSTSAVSWTTEGNAPAGSSNFSADAVPLAPFAATCYSDISRKAFSTMEAAFLEATVAGDLMGSIAAAVDAVALVGGGTNQPDGLLTTPGIPVVALGANGRALTMADLVAMEQAAAGANADALPGWAASINVRARLRLTERAAGNGWVWSDGNTIAGAPAYATTALPDDLAQGTGTNLGVIAYSGDWSELVIGHWGAVEILRDPFVAGTSGGIRLVASFAVDVAVRHAGSFIIAKGVVTT